ncbi:alpha/beta fold hydrolase [Chitinophaga sp. sic0106]|uniref:alpha/beta fold hydrolase n=1 Tax=Chitinophaga sp. sic0106 TaxID=2854785 RepID=UPI001C452383|nr:alpha/beta hydrolase [Chitinophaga sp. sic0106]MBV7530522.1 alpha/beta hydrolase [Chitinophaga sp. sic0106]
MAASYAYAQPSDSLPHRSGHAAVNGISMYYEIYGEGKPLVLLHGGGSTIQSTFGRALPYLSQNRKVIAVELQAHGRTSDRPADETFEQDADDVAALLKQLGIDKADFLGFSNGATTTCQIAIRHPELVNKLVLGSVLCKRNGMPDWFWDVMQKAQLSNMPPELKTAYLQVKNDANGLQTMHDKDAKRMVNFKDIPDEQLKGIQAPVLIILADKDVIKPEHGIMLSRMLPHAELAIIPGIHGEYLEEITTVKIGSKQASYVMPMVASFLDK